MNDDAATAVGCALIVLWFFAGLAWLGFLIWAIYSVVSWLVTK